MTPALNVDKFIEDIKNRPVLWHRDYPKVVKALQEAWTDISICHGIPQRLLKTKWKTLRDTFRVEMKKIPRTDDGEFAIPPQTYQSQWVHYKQMSFLAGQMRLRDPPQEDLSDPVNYNIGYPMEDHDGHHGYSMEYDETTYEDSKELLRQQLEEKPRPMTHSRKPASKSKASSKKKARHSAPASTPSRVSSRPKPKPKPKPPSPKPTITTTTSEVAAPSPRLNDEDSQGSGGASPKDDDYYFLMSLHPYMQQLKHAQKLQARMEIQNIVFKRLYSQGEF